MFGRTLIRNPCTSVINHLHNSPYFGALSVLSPGLQRRGAVDVAQLPREGGEAMLEAEEDASIVYSKTSNICL